MKRVTSSLAKHFVCARCKNVMERAEEPVGNLSDRIETVNGFCYLRDRLNASGGCEAAVTARARFGWVKFRECGELLYGKRFSLKMKGRVYQTCVRPATLYGSETWCLRESEMGTLRRTERAMVRAMCGVKLVDKRNTTELMDMLGLRVAADKLAKANAVRLYGHVLRREEDNVLRKALRLTVEGQRRRGRPKKTLSKQVEESIRKVGMSKEDAQNRARWRRGVELIMSEVR